ncbi:MAG: serine hydrolase domain-containing protein [bacterium]|nr:serine hydrolase domain-containing protein [bacterium]
MSLKRLLPGLMLLFVLSGTSAAQSTEVDIATIDAYIEDAMAAERIPGLALAIVHQDQIVYAQGYGQTGIDSQAVTPNTAFQLGSMSKSFTALAVLQLVEAGRVDLDAPVQQYLPDFRVGSDDDSAEITVRRLLHHTSGIPERAPRAEGDDQSLPAQVAALANTELAHAPGSTYEYSSPNYLVLGRIVEVVSGQSFADYVEQHIFQPLNMTSSYTSMDEARQGDFAVGHQLWFGFPRPSSLPHEPGRLPTASLISSAADLGNYLIAQLNGGAFEENVVLSSTLMELMHTPAVPAEENRFYAMGWRVGPVKGVPAIHHGGILPDYRGKMVLLPEAGWGVVVLTNVSAALGRPSSHDIADNLAGMLVGEPLNSSGLGLGMIYFGVAIGAALLTINQLRNLVALGQWRRQQLDAQGRVKNRPRLLADLAFGLTFPVILLVGLPLFFGFSWSTLIEQVPDLGYWALFVSGLEWVITLLRVAVIVPALRPVPAPA